MKMPTVDEVKIAGKQYRDELPGPMGQAIDDSKELSMLLVFHIHQANGPLDLETVIKSAMIIGLQYGIRIGEARGKAS